MDIPKAPEMITITLPLEQYLEDQETLRHAVRAREIETSGQDAFTVALENLLHHAVQDHSGGRRCAMFLLSLWNWHDYRVGLVDMFHVDNQVFEDMITVLLHLRKKGRQIDSIVRPDQIGPVLDLWRDKLKSPKT